MKVPDETIIEWFGIIVILIFLALIAHVAWISF